MGSSPIKSAIRKKSDAAKNSKGSAIKDVLKFEEEIGNEAEPNHPNDYAEIEKDEERKIENILENDDQVEEIEINANLNFGTIKPTKNIKKSDNLNVKKTESKINEIKKQKFEYFNYSDVKMLELLGQGSFGTVFRAYNNKTSEFIALKFYKDPQEDTLEEIEHEHDLMSAVKKVNNEKFLKYYGLFKDPKLKDGYILVMESGERNLMEILKIRIKYELEEVVFIFRSLLIDFINLQANGIANCDVKTENIILVANKNNSEKFDYKISDFGIGLIVKNNKIDIDEILGFTPVYAAPEIIKINKDQYNLKEYDPFKADVYSLAKIITELLGFKNIYDENLKENILFNLLNDMLQSDPEIRLDFKSVLKRLDELNIIPKEPINEKKYIKEWENWKNTKLTPQEILNNIFSNISAYKYIAFNEKLKELIESCDLIYKKNVSILESTEYELKICKEKAYLNREILENIKEALTFDLKYLEIALKLYSKENKIIGDAYSFLGRDYNLLNDYENCEKYLLLSLETREKIYGKNSIITAHSYNELAILYKNVKQDFKKAEKYYLLSLEIHLNVLGEYHRTTACCYNNFAGFYSSINKNDALAEEYYLKALNIREKVLGEYHPDTATTYHDFALYYKNSKQDYENAEKYFLKSLEIRLKKLGENHTDTAISYNGLAVFYSYCKQDFVKAENYYLKALKIRETIFGIENSNTAITYNDIALFYYKIKKDYIKAEDYYNKTIQIREKVLGENHYLTAQSYNGAAIFFEKIKKDFQKSGLYLEKSLKIREEIFGKNSLNSAQSYNDLGLFYKNLKNYEKAEEYLLKAYDIWFTKGNLKSTKIALCSSNLASFYFSIKKDMEKAEKYYLSTLEIREKIFGNQHSLTAKTYNDIAIFYVNGNIDIQKSENYFLKCLEVREKLFGGNHSDTLSIIRNLAQFYFKKKIELDISEKYYNRLIDSYDKLNIKKGVENGKIYQEAGIFFKHIKNKQKEQELFKKAISIYQNSEGNNKLLIEKCNKLMKDK